MSRLPFALLLGAAAVAAPAAAQTRGDRLTPLDEVVVTATRTPKPITAIPSTVKVIDRQALETQLAVSTSLLDSLSFSIPSFSPGRQKMTSTGESLRGRTPLYMVDGIPQSTPLRDGKRSGFTLDPAFVDRVEVIYGANAIQGVGATGGVINYVTVTAPRSGEWLNRVGLELTTDDFQDDGLHKKASLISARKVGPLDFVVGGAYQTSALFYDGRGRPVGIDTTQGDLMDTDAWNLFSKLGWDLSEHQRVVLTANVFDQRGDGDYVGVPGSIGSGIAATSRKGDPAGDPTRNEAVNLAVSYRHSDLAGGDLTLQGFYYDFYALYGGDTFPVFQDPAIAPAGSLFDQSALASEKYGAKLTFVREDAVWPGLQLVAGADYLRDSTYQELAQTDRLWVPEMIYEGWAPFVQLEQRLASGRVRLSGGLRYENATLKVPDFTTIASANRTFVQGGSPSFHEVLTNAGLVVEPLDGLTVFTSYAEGFTMPDAGLILRAVRTPGQTVEQLVDLKPVIADNVEIGAGYRAGGLELSASYFWSGSELGSRIQVIGGAGVVQREKTRIRGLELSGRYIFPNGGVVGGAFAALEGRFDSNGDGNVDKDLDGRNISPDRLNLYAQTPLGAAFTGRLQVSHLIDRTFDGGLPQHDFDGYTLVDAILTYDGGHHGRFTVAVANLLDESYLTYFSQTATFVTDRDFVAGRGRTVSLRWQGTF